MMADDVKNLAGKTRPLFPINLYSTNKKRGKNGTRTTITHTELIVLPKKH